MYYIGQIILACKELSLHLCWADLQAGEHFLHSIIAEKQYLPGAGRPASWAYQGHKSATAVSPQGSPEKLLTGFSREITDPAQRSHEGLFKVTPLSLVSVFKTPLAPPESLQRHFWGLLLSPRLLNTTHKFEQSHREILKVFMHFWPQVLPQDFLPKNQDGIIALRVQEFSSMSHTWW